MNYSISLTTSLKRNPYEGFYIALEGIDGSGKTSQTERLKKHFLAQGKNVTTVQFPRKSDGILATINKSVLKGTSNIPKAAFQYLFSADYVMLLEEEIIPALTRGDIVISDRFHCWSSLAYGIWENGQTQDRDIAQSLLITNGLLSKHTQFFVPDITLFLEVSVATAMQRIEEKEKDVYEREEILSEIAKGYAWLRKEFPDEFKTIDAEKPLADVTNSMISELNKQKNNPING